MAAKRFSEDEILRLLRLRAIGRYPTDRALCAEQAISARTLREWRRNFESRLTWTLEDWVRSALVAGAATIEEMASWIDWRNHALHSRDELEGVLRGLAERGAVCAGADGRWQLIQSWP